MTCVVGIEYEGKVILAGDSAGVDGLTLQIRTDEKVFHNGEFVFSFTSSFRMGQLLRYVLKPPKQKPSQDDMKFLVADFIPAVKDVYEKHGYLSTADNEDGVSGEDRGGIFMIGYRGLLYCVDIDFHVYRTPDGYNACGCGSQLALGSLHTTALINAALASENVQRDPTLFHTPIPPETRLTMALDAACSFSAGVSGPYNFVTLHPTTRRTKK